MKPEYRYWMGALAAAVLVLGLVAPLGQASLAAGATIYVDADATGAGDGTSWADAFTELLFALDEAASGDQIWVAEGIYKPFFEEGREATFQLKSGVALYGGFDPSIGDDAWEDRNWETNLTTLSGDIGTAGDISDNCYHVVSGMALDTAAVLDGFTISGGHANSGTDPWRWGGGLYLLNSSLTIRNVKFQGNRAGSGGGLFIEGGQPVLDQVEFSQNEAYDTGGGMHVYNSSPTMTDITFSENTSYVDGGGMYNINSQPSLTEVTFSRNTAEESGGGMYNNNSDPTLTNATFFQNDSNYGGGMNNQSGSSPTLTNISLQNNYADYGAGMYNADNSNPHVTGATFFGNEASFQGGGMYNNISHPVLVDVIFNLNEGGGYGGGILNHQSHPQLENVTFTSNSSQRGGGIYNSSSDAWLVNVIFSVNSSDEGGGMYNAVSYPILTNVTFSRNYAGTGGGIYNFYSRPTLTNAILWENSSQLYDDYWDSYVTYSDIQGGWEGIGNIDSDPQFVNVATGDLRLQLTSPAIDAGDNTAVPTGITTDLLGLPRFFDVFSVLDTGFGTPPIVDMGAYEAQAVAAFLPIVTR